MIVVRERKDLIIMCGGVEGGASGLWRQDVVWGAKCKPRLYNYHSFTIGNGLHLRLEIEYSDFNALNLEGLINC